MLKEHSFGSRMHLQSIDLLLNVNSFPSKLKKKVVFENFCDKQFQKKVVFETLNASY